MTPKDRDERMDGGLDETSTRQSEIDESSDESGVSIRDELKTPQTGSVFNNKDLVRPDTIIDEDRIVGRDHQLRAVIGNLRPMLQDAGIPDMLLTGPSGTGKSLILNAVCKQIVDISETEGMSFGVLFLNCQSISTTSRAVYRLVETAADDIGIDPEIPQSGVSTDLKLQRLYEIIRNHYDGVIFILDEVDELKGPYEEEEYNTLIYQLSRARNLADFGGPVSLTTITNYTDFMSDLNSRSSSSYNPDNIFFDDYDATQLQKILDHRRDAFKEGVLTNEVIPLIAELGSQTHGDARAAIDLFRWAGEGAEKRGGETVEENDVWRAQEQYEKDQSLRHVSGVSTQKKAALFAVASVDKYGEGGMEWIPSGPAFAIYEYVASQVGINMLSRESFVTHMNNLSTSGLVSNSRRGKGRGKGVAMHYSLEVDPDLMIDTIVEDGEFNHLNEKTDELQRLVEGWINN